MKLSSVVWGSFNLIGGRHGFWMGISYGFIMNPTLTKLIQVDLWLSNYFSINFVLGVFFENSIIRGLI